MTSWTACAGPSPGSPAAGLGRECGSGGAFGEGQARILVTCLQWVPLAVRPQAPSPLLRQTVTSGAQKRGAGGTQPALPQPPCQRPKPACSWGQVCAPGVQVPSPRGASGQDSTARSPPSAPQLLGRVSPLEERIRVRRPSGVFPLLPSWGWFGACVGRDGAMGGGAVGHFELRVLRGTNHVVGGSPRPQEGRRSPGSAPPRVAPLATAVDPGEHPVGSARPSRVGRRLGWTPAR